ncbi:hypothetical protein TetV_582 [Tetraselmis virus 1]|uniref:Uncharacterized protein n=1 Tax=Tetraselmis virus 1 TaxID=2060617 RepID=A0A2P0VP38_9VIRU|nr:hypothetical protein QJ968_gp472 [Tetraselmis virus 1]AUF82664.1 hypothetical protein TetV_582 [Tetraselmis virus 1]
MASFEHTFSHRGYGLTLSVSCNDTKSVTVLVTDKNNGNSYSVDVFESHIKEKYQLQSRDSFYDLFKHCCNNDNQNSSICFSIDKAVTITLQIKYETFVPVFQIDVVAPLIHESSNEERHMVEIRNLHLKYEEKTTALLNTLTKHYEEKIKKLYTEMSDIVNTQRDHQNHLKIHDNCFYGLLNDSRGYHGSNGFLVKQTLNDNVASFFDSTDLLRYTVSRDNIFTGSYSIHNNKDFDTSKLCHLQITSLNLSCSDLTRVHGLPKTLKQLSMAASKKVEAIDLSHNDLLEQIYVDEAVWKRCKDSIPPRIKIEVFREGTTIFKNY